MAKNNEDHEYITLEFEDGVSVACAVLGVFEAEGRDYIALLDEDANEVYFYRYLQADEDHYEIGDIETDEEFDAVSATFDEVFDMDDLV